MCVPLLRDTLRPGRVGRGRGMKRLDEADWRRLLAGSLLPPGRHHTLLASCAVGVLALACGVPSAQADQIVGVTPLTAQAKGALLTLAGLTVLDGNLNAPTPSGSPDVTVVEGTLPSPGDI